MDQHLGLSPFLNPSHGCHGFSASLETRSVASEVRGDLASAIIVGKPGSQSDSSCLFTFVFSTLCHGDRFPSPPSFLGCSASPKHLHFYCKYEHHDVFHVSWLPVEGSPGDSVRTVSFRISPVVSVRTVRQPPSFVGKLTCVCSCILLCVAFLRVSSKRPFPFPAGRNFELQRQALS